MMNRILVTLLFSNFILFASAQNAPNNFFPKEKLVLDVSGKRQKELKRRDHLLTKEHTTKQEKKELDTLLQKGDETVESVWDIIPGGCSWYCSGGNYEIKASSSLPNANGINYSAKSANDLSYATAWVEGREDEGIGEYLEYYFENQSPRVTKIIVSNGYVKSEAAWKNNNRVKRLKFYVNGKPYGFLNLSDTRDDQVFDIGTFGRNKNGKDLIFRFEILEVYKGDKYNDTAITEIYFDGIDDH